MVAFIFGLLLGAFVTIFIVAMVKANEDDE